MIEFEKKQTAAERHSMYVKRQHNLDRTKEYFNARVNIIRACYSHEVHGMGSLNWPHWDKFRVLLCNIYGVSCVDQIPDNLVEDANDLAIDMLQKMFDKNMEILDRKEKSLTENKN